MRTVLLAVSGVVCYLLQRRHGLLPRTLQQLYLRMLSDDGHVERTVDGFRMYLDLDDRGLSSALLDGKTHEEESVAVYRSELERVKRTTDGTVTVLDIGANKGYFAFHAVTALRPAAEVHAIEPDPRNFEALDRGTQSNEFDEWVTTYSFGLGDRNGTAELYRSNHANWHTVAEPSNWRTAATPPDFLERSFRDVPNVSVPLKTIETFLGDAGIEPEDVDVVRFDIEGYETVMVEELSLLFEAGAPQLLFFEVHPHLIGKDGSRDVIETVAAEGFELVGARSPATNDLETYADVYEHCRVEESSHTVELILRRDDANE